MDPNETSDQGSRGPAASGECPGSTRVQGPPWHLPWLLALFVGATAFYFSWRPSAINPEAVGLSYVLLVAELYGVVMGALHIWMTWRLTERTPPPPLGHVSIDVLIPTYNESVDIVRRTLAAAVAMDLPHTTWLLDDGNRPEMEQLARSVGARYLARADHAHAKAGNLNHALQHAKGDFVAIFDADHVPNKHFLTRTLGYFRDPDVAFVQTPQDFYNTDSFQHRERNAKGLVWTEQSLFFRVIQRGKDFFNAAFFCGSCAIARRSALDGIGGFATSTITEDLHTSIRLHKAGWKSVYHAESLAFGIAPATMDPFITQRIRWGQGAMQVWRQEGLLFAKGLTIAQRLNYFASVSTYFDGWQKAILYFLPVYSLWTGQLPLRTDVGTLMLHWLPFIVLNYLVFEELARGYGRSLYVEQYNLARFFAFAYATLSLFWKRPLSFKVTDKEHTGQSGSGATRPVQVVYLLNLTAIPIGVALYLAFGHIGLEGLMLACIWSLINVVLASSVIRFAGFKTRYRRKNHRFGVPHAIELFRGPTRLPCVIDNLSIDGCRIYGKVPIDLKDDECINALLHLPNKVLPLSLVVRHRFRQQHQGTSFITAIGCTVDWSSDTDKLALEQYLYGSDHQWSLNNLTEQDHTPLEKVTRWIMRRPARLHQKASDWQPLIHTNGQVLGVISQRVDPSSGHVRAISTETPHSHLIGVIAVGRRQNQTLDLRLIDYRMVSTPAKPYFLCTYARS